ncbi:MAG: hypoxanthine phosphoribosyltransferase [Verrucomicrobiota bacterium]
MSDLPGKVLFSEDTLSERIAELGQSICSHYGDKPITVIGLMNGSLFFMADLLRHLPVTTRLECWRVSSYLGQRSTGKIQGLDSHQGDYRGRNVLIIDDILDTGLTLAEVKRTLQAGQASDIEICVLLRKLGTLIHPIEAKWIGFEIPDQFVIGYGLDLDHQYRTLPMIRLLDKDN